MKDCTLAWPKKADEDVAVEEKAPSVLSDVSLTINRGSRIVVRGPNGAGKLKNLRYLFITNSFDKIHSNCYLSPHRYYLLGKSTLLSALSGRLAPLNGARSEGDGLELGVFTQDLAQDLDQEARAVDVVTTKVRVLDPTISDEKARAALGALGLTGEKAIRKVGFLSGKPPH